MQTLDSPEVEAERAMLVPASPTWFGRKPDRSQPLTDEAMRAWMESGAIVPPADHQRLGIRISNRLKGALIFGILLAMVLAFGYGAWSK